MAVSKRESYVWHVGETATPFRYEIRNADGSAFDDVASAEFTLVNADTGATMIDSAACQSVASGVLLYYPDTGELSTACRFRAQFVATLTGGAILPGVWFEGEIQANL